MNPYLNIDIGISGLLYLYKYGILLGFGSEFEISKPTITVKLEETKEKGNMGMHSCKFLVFLNGEQLPVDIRASKFLKLEKSKEEALAGIGGHILDWEAAAGDPKMYYFRKQNPNVSPISQAFNTISENTTPEFVNFLNEIENNIFDTFVEWNPNPTLADIETVLAVDPLDQMYQLSFDKLSKDRLNWKDVPLLKSSIVQKVLIIYQPLPESTPVYIPYGIYTDNIVYFALHPFNKNGRSASTWAANVFTNRIELVKAVRVEWFRKNVHLEDIDISDILNEYDLEFISYLEKIVKQLQQDLEKERLYRSTVLEP